MVAPTFISDELGTQKDTVKLAINGQRIAFATGWEVHESVLSQPASWSIRIGRGDIAQQLLDACPPRSTFELYIGDVLQFKGRTDSRGAQQSEGSATELEIGGRDALAPLHDTYVATVTSANVGTYAQLVWFALQQVGIVDPSQHAIDPSVLATDNVANRQLKAGVSIAAIAPHRTVQQILDDVGLTGANVGIVHTPPQARIGETWHRFIRRYIDRAGLMLWAAAGGGFVLSAPDGSQAPTYELRRLTGEARPGGNVVGMSWREDTTHRHTEAIIYGRGGGKAFGRVKAKGGFPDAEMLGFGFKNQPVVLRDRNVHSAVEAAFAARRHLAEERREGWHLEYTIAGHTLPYLPAGAGTSTRAVIVPDTLVSVKDDELGFNESFYIESVIRRRSPQTTTTIRLMRTEDLLFANPDETDD